MARRTYVSRCESTMRIIYTKKQGFYGMDRRPANDEAQFICDLTNTRIITDRMIDICFEYGHTVIDIEQLAAQYDIDTSSQGDTVNIESWEEKEERLIEERREINENYAMESWAKE